MSLVRRNLWTYLSSSLLWVVLALIYSIPAWASGSMTPLSALLLALREWLPWIVLSPVIMAIAGKFPWVPGGRIKAAVVILAVAVSAVWGAEYFFQRLFNLRERGPAPMARASDGPEFGPPPGEDGPPPFRENERPDFGEGERPPPPGGERPRRPVNGPARRVLVDRVPEGERALSGPLRHMMHFHVPICLFVIVLAHAYAYHQRMLERERRAAELTASLSEAKLMALQMQLQPHFLFNSLNALSALVHTDPQAADDMIANLSELLRRALGAANHREVTLEKEMEYLECYLGIERVRFGNRLEVDWRIDSNTKHALVPVLVLQPIVENAIRHGVERRRADVGKISIASEVAGGKLRVIVTDNGPGLPAIPSAPRGHGIGVSNTRARLASLYGDDACLTLANATKCGCVATVELPLRRQHS